MPRHGERIRKRKDGRWEGRYKTGNAPDGKTLYASVYGKSYAEVKQKLADSETEVNSYTVSNRSRYLFSYAVDQWFNTNRHKLKRSTEHRYMYLIDNHILPSLGGIRVNSITTIMLNEFAQKKLDEGKLSGSGGLSKSYVRSMMLIVDAVMKFAAREQWCTPLLTPIYKPFPEKKELAILKSSDQLVLEKNLKNEHSPTAVGILLTLQTGLRIGEVCALRWADIDFDESIIHVRSTISRVKSEDDSKYATKLIIDTPKTTNSARDIPICSYMCKKLKQLQLESASEYVVSDKHGFVSPRTYEYRYHRLMENIGLPSLNYHALRHTFATRCIECGVDAKTLSELLGHSNVSITLNTYVHPSMERKRAQIEKMINFSQS